MHGLLLVNKEVGYTCQDVCNCIKRKFNVKKVGHCGTLDPFADGLLIVGINEGTKILSFLETHNKTYLATLELGIKTDTGDCTGNVIETNKVKQFDKKEIIDVFDSFIGIQKQIPPMYSAIKINGKKLYEYARNNQNIERKAREIQIFLLELVEYRHPLVTFKVTCSKGTYIRTLGEDIASKLNTVGHLKSLTRLNIDNYSLENAKKIADLTENDIQSIASMVPFKFYLASDKELNDIKNGKRVKLNSNEKQLLILDKNNKAIAIYELEKDNIYRSIRGFYYENN